MPHPLHTFRTLHPLHTHVARARNDCVTLVTLVTHATCVTRQVDLRDLQELFQWWDVMAFILSFIIAFCTCLLVCADALGFCAARLLQGSADEDAIAIADMFDERTLLGGAAELSWAVEGGGADVSSSPAQQEVEVEMQSSARSRGV